MIDRSYWTARQEQIQQKLTNKTEKQIEGQLKSYYRKTMSKIIQQFIDTYEDVLSKLGEGKTPTAADLYKLDKYWQLQGTVKKELEKLGDFQLTLLSKKFEQQFKEVYEALAIKGVDEFKKVDKTMAAQMVNSIWCADGKNWSQRVWLNTDKLQQALNDNLIHSVIIGTKSGDLKKKLMADFNVSYNRADTIVRTELAHIQTEAAKKRYQDYGITQVEVLVEHDACPVCKKLKNKKFSAFGQMPVPAHPNCKCCIVPVI